MAITINGSTGIEMASDDSLGFGDIGLSADTLFSGRKNVIINGDFDVWQRGTGAFTTSVYTADRWKASFTGGTQSVTQQAFTLGQTDVPNEPKYYFRNIVTTSVGASNFHYLSQRVEDVRTFAGQTVTLSLYAKADASKDVAIEFVQNFGTGGSPSSSVFFIGVTTLSLTTSWQKFEVTVSIPSISGKTLGSNNDDHLELRIYFDAGSAFDPQTNSLGNQSGTFDIAQVQLEKGSQATAFEKRSYGEELALCQRYCVAWGEDEALGFGVVAASNSFTDRVIVPLQNNLRTTPTSSLSGTLTIHDGSTTQTSSVINYLGYFRGRLMMNLTMGGTLTAHRPAYVNVTSGSILIFEAEL